MKLAIYDKKGVKLAGSVDMPENLNEEILAKPMPFYAEGRLYSKLDGEMFSAVCMDAEAARRIMRIETDGKGMTREGFLFSLLNGRLTVDEAITLGARLRVPFEVRRSVAVVIFAGEAEFEEAGLLKEIFDEVNADVIQMGHMRYAAVCESRDGQEDFYDTCMALRDTFLSEVNIDAFIGIGQPCETASSLSEAYSQAAACAELGASFSHYGGVFSYNRMFPEILLKGVPTEYISKFASAAAKISGASDEETMILLDELFKQNLNISKTAKELYMHRNTLIYRLDKLRRVTGLDVSCFDDAVILRLMLAMSRLGEK